MDKLAEEERQKYEKIWTFDQYRKVAPGETLVSLAIKSLGIKAGDSVIDFGCGTGRPTQQFKTLGIQVVGVDFASNCLDTSVCVPFVQACLWEPLGMLAKYGFCTDVMEHIPENKVDAVLENILDCTEEGVFFQIATRPDGCGRLIGKKLHLTIHDADWWKNKLGKYWATVNIGKSAGSFVAVCK